MNAVARIYQRAYTLARDWPWLLLVPLMAELVQHVVEIRLGMYSGAIDAAGLRLRLAFGILKIAAIVCTMVVAWRLWGFDGDVGRAFKPTRLLLKGVVTFILVQIIGDLVAIGTGRGLIALAHQPSRSIQIALASVPLFVWLLGSATLFPWYVGLATEDRKMTLTYALQASRGHLIATWGILCWISTVYDRALWSWLRRNAQCAGLAVHDARRRRRCVADGH